MSLGQRSPGPVKLESGATPFHLRINRSLGMSMSYPSFPGYNGDYRSSSGDRSSAYGAARPDPAAVPVTTSPAYPVSSNHQQYGSTVYAWPDRKQSTYGPITGSSQSYGNTGWKDGHGQQSVYNYPRPQTNYAASQTTNNSPHVWLGANTQPQAQGSTQALNNLAYASGLGSQDQRVQEDRKTPHSYPASQHFELAQREGHGQERIRSPSYGRRYISSNTRTSQTAQAEQSPASSHQSLAVSAAAALAGAVNGRYNSSPQHPNVSTQLSQAPFPSVPNAGDGNPPNSVSEQNEQRPATFHDSNARDEPQTQPQNFINGRAPPSHNLSRYETTETHRYAQPSSPNVTLPLPSTTRTLQSKESHITAQPSVQNNDGVGRSPEKPDAGTQISTMSKSIETSNGMSRQQIHEPAISMPTFIDPSRVFNPYHREHERQRREEAKRNNRASIEAAEPRIGSKCEDASTNQTVEAAATTTLAGSKNQVPTSANTDKGVRPSSRSSSTTADPKESGDIDMAKEMKAMMHRMREWKTKDPSLFQKLWDDMKKGGSGMQGTKGQISTESQQIAQGAPPQSPRSQSSQLGQLETSSAPQTLSQNRQPVSGDASKASSKLQQHRDLAMVVENNEEGLPDLGHFPVERGNRRRNQEAGEGESRKDEAKRSALTPPTTTSPDTSQTKQDSKLMWSTQATSQPPTTTNAISTAVSTQTLPPTSQRGGTIWPEAKRKALAETAQKALLGLKANKDKSITAAEIHALLEQNPSYIELCAKLEERGFVFHRAQFARFILNNVPDLSSPSQTQEKTTQQSHPAIAPRVQPPQQVVRTGVAGQLAISNDSTQNDHPPPRSSAYINFRLAPAPRPKTTPLRPAKARLGVPSPNIPTPVPGSKEAKARKRDFSELVDLTQLSDDEDYVMPRKQARHEQSPEQEGFQVKTDIHLPNAATRMSDTQRHSHGQSCQNPYRPIASTAPLKFDPQAQTSVSQLQSLAPAQPSRAMPPKCRHLLAKPLNKAEALRKSYYDPKTVARDILIAAGRHPAEHALNAHLGGLLGKHIDIDSDVSTFDWDTVDPGGPPMPVVRVVDIPAGPPRWKMGQRMKVRGPTMGTLDPPPKTGAPKGVKRLELGTTVSNGIAESRSDKESGKEEPGRGHIPEVQSSLARLSSQTKFLLEESLQAEKASRQPTRLRQSHTVVDEHPKSPMRCVRPVSPDSCEETTPHHTKSITPVSLHSPSSQHSPKRGPGRPRKLITMDQASPGPAKRRGRPPGSKNRPASMSLPKKAAKSSGPEVSIPIPRRSTSAPQYNIYACRWRKCNAKLHNLPTLRKHVARVHKVTDDQTRGEGQPCLWKKCRTLEVQGEEIVPKVTFNSTSDWLDHIDSDHLHAIGMELGDGPSSAQTGKPKPFEVSKYFYYPHSVHSVSRNARTCSHTDPQTLARDRQIYLSDKQGHAVTAPSTKTTISAYPSDTLVLSSVTMEPESNIPNRAFSKAHGNEKMEIRQSAIETLVALQRHKELVGPGLDRGGCTLVNAERRATLIDNEGMARVVDADY